jgi:hypothetical protein
MEGSAQQAHLRNNEEGVRLATAARKARMPLKLFGGVAVWLLCESARRPPLARDYADIDYATLSNRTQEVSRFLESQGYVADRLFNALHSASRMRFTGAVADRTVDVIVDRFVESHAIDLRPSVRSDELTIPVTELLLTKLQVVQINEKDLKDIVAILLDHPLGLSGSGVIDKTRVAALTCADWGLERTIRGALGRVDNAVGEFGLTFDSTVVVRSRVQELLRDLDATPKSIAWRLRALVGERLRWYEIPEESRR